jgi:hypothetical protein
MLIHEVEPSVEGRLTALSLSTRRPLWRLVEGRRQNPDLDPDPRPLARQPQPAITCP